MPVAIEATDFGPLARARVSLAPLTVFIGPNNTGKSVAAMLTYAAMLSTPDRDFTTSVSRTRYLRRAGALRSRLYLPDQVNEELEGAVLAVLESAALKRHLGASDVPEPLTEALEHVLERSLVNYGRSLCTELERCFGAPLQDLARTGRGRGAPPATIKVSSMNPRWGIAIALSARGPQIEVTMMPSLSKLLGTARDRGARIFEEDRYYTLSAEYLVAHFLEAMVAACFVGFPSVPYYLPAARSGILQSHKALASFVMRRAPLAGIEDMNIPRMSGVITDFIGLLLNIDAYRTGDFASVAHYVEETMLQGHIQMEARPHTYPEISYQAGRQEFPLHRTSSMISEMAPMVLYLRYLLNTGELLIIEEPESHLHPSSQLGLAKAIATLVNGGMQVTLTTHSDFFLQQLNNMIMAGSLKNAALASEALGVDEAPTLRAEQVRAYLFGQSPRLEGTVVRSLKVSESGGIDEDEFGRVTESLYNETVVLERRLMDP